MKLTEKQFQLFTKNRLEAKENKYKNKKVFYDGHEFDSQKERNYYIQLKLLEQAKLITDIELQPKFELQPSFKRDNKTIRAINYIGDFKYYDLKTNQIVVVDVKGFKTKEYLIKKKMFMYKYPGIEFKEIL